MAGSSVSPPSLSSSGFPVRGGGGPGGVPGFFTTGPPLACGSREECFSLNSLTCCLQQAATIGTALFAGGSLFISMALHPARMALPAAEALTNFQQLFKPTACYMASLAGGSSLLSGVAYLLERRHQGSMYFLSSCVGLLGIFGYTYVCMRGTNRQLLGEGGCAVDWKTPSTTSRTAGDKEPSSSAEQKVALLNKWNCLHWLRSLVGCVALCSCLQGLLSRKRSSVVP